MPDDELDRKIYELYGINEQAAPQPEPRKRRGWRKFVYTAIVYLTLPYGPIIREKIYKSFPPKILETYPIKYPSSQIKEKRGFLFSAEGKQGLGIYDISRPDTMNEVSRVIAGDSVSNFYESRKIFYLVDGAEG